MQYQINVSFLNYRKRYVKLSLMMPEGVAIIHKCGNWLLISLQIKL